MKISLKTIFLIIILTNLTFILFGQSEVKIGKLTWMSSNLNVEKFRNGDNIHFVESREEWNKAAKERKPAWCYYDDNPANGEKYGKLYNWYAVNDPRGLAPEGWHVASKEEYIDLVYFIGNWCQGLCNNNSGVKLKNQFGWADNKNGINNSKWSGLPGGMRNSSHGYNNAMGGEFNHIGKYGYWWFSNSGYYGVTYSFELNQGETTCDRENNYGAGLSVRCVKNSN